MARIRRLVPAAARAFLNGPGRHGSRGGQNGRELADRMLLRMQVPVTLDDSSEASQSTISATSFGLGQSLQVEAAHVLLDPAGLLGAGTRAAARSPSGPE